jgi:hypothetical protein
MSNEKDWADSQPYDVDELLGPPPRSIKKKSKEQKEIEKFMRRKIHAVQRNDLEWKSQRNCHLVAPDH